MSIKEKMTMAKEDKKKMLYLLTFAMGLLVFLMFFNGGGKEEAPHAEDTVAQSQKEGSYDETEALNKVLGEIEGVGKVSVAIQYQGVSKKEYAYNEETSSRATGKEGENATETMKTKEMVLLKGDETPVVIEETYPGIKGVVVVAEGAYDPWVQEQIIEAVITFLDIGANRVKICTMQQ